MDFSFALLCMRKGDKYTRLAWGDQKKCLRVEPTLPLGLEIKPSDLMTKGVKEGLYLPVSNGSGGFDPFIPSQADLLAEDWGYVE